MCLNSELADRGNFAEVDSLGFAAQIKGLTVTALTDLTLAGDGSNSYTFTALGQSGGKVIWSNRVNGIPRFSPRLEVTVVEPKSATGAYRILGSLILPKTVTVEGVTSLVRQNRINFDYNFAPDSTSAERVDDHMILRSLFASTAFGTMVTNLSAPN